MLKRSSIKSAILLPVTLLLLAGVLGMNLVIFVRSSSITEDLTYQIMDEAVNRYANQLKDETHSMITLATSAAPLTNHMRATPNARNHVVESLQSVLLANPNILAVWTIWEPDAFDGRDSFYRGNAYHDETGRFAPYIYNHNGIVRVETVQNLDSGEIGRFYAEAVGQDSLYYCHPFERITETGSKTVYAVAVPIMEQGKVLGVIGVDIDLDAFNERMNEVKVLNNGFLMIIGPEGYLLSHPNPSRQGKYYLEAKDIDYSDKIGQVLAAGGSAQATDYSTSLQTDAILYFQGVEIDRIPGYWVISCVVPSSILTRPTLHLALLCSALGLVLIIAAGLAIHYIVNRNLSGLFPITKAALLLADGKVEQADPGSVGTQETANEITLLRQAFSKMIAVTREQAGVIRKIADGDLTVQVKPRSDEDIIAISLKEMVAKDNQVFASIRQAAEIVNAGSEQISAGAQMLAQSTMEQSSSMSELSSAVQEISRRSQENESLAERAAQFSEQVREIADNGYQKITQLTTAVRDINQASQSISNVIKVIDDIAFQTNILALNAAVEAARAGVNGKGFAVVAEEVRNLAAKSAAAAKDTGELISGTVDKTALGEKIAAETAVILKEILENIHQNSEIVGQIPPSSRQQSVAIEQINLGIRQVTEAAHQNSTTTEESASTSEELSSQARMLHQLISYYQISDPPATAAPSPSPHPSATDSDTIKGFSLH